MINKENKNIIFLKPFEVNASFTPIINTWKIISRKLKGNSELMEASLLRAVYENTKFGFVSTSVWKSKDAFKRILAQNTILRLHHSSFGNGKMSGTQYLYKVVFEEKNLNANKRNSNTELFFLKSDGMHGKKIPHEWEQVKEELRKTIIEFDLKIYKAIYIKNKIGIILSLSYNNKENIKIFIIELINKIFENKNIIHNSVYKTESTLKSNN